MKRQHFMGICFCIMLISSQSVVGEENTKHPGLFNDTWLCEYTLLEGVLDETHTMTIDIEPEMISWTIDEHLLESIEFEYLYSTLPGTKPYLCVFAQDGDDRHTFCGILNEAVPFNKLIGVYEYSTLRINQRLGTQGERWSVEVAVELLGESEDR